jgi:hypothetical protein
MCFNATVSFTAGAVIGVTGLATLKKIERPAQLPFAFIPIIFSLQQITEGFLWVVFNHGEYAKWQQPLTVIFILIAQVVWPFWVPLSIMLAEQNKKRKDILKALFGMGLTFSMFGAYRLLFFSVVAQIEEHHIKYSFDFSSALLNFTPAFYILPIILSPFISSVKKMTLLGILVTASLLLAVFFFEQYAISVWCFFAAVISVVVFLIVKGFNINL